ncbi:MAG: helix-turn-helix domain-containing protein [Candidatus Heteroscillospira sp.]|jgi:transcriptional regulator with XRE-family HTH domain
MAFGENLQYLRKEADMTQEELAERLGVSRQTVSKWEQGGSYPEMEKLMQMCGLFDSSMDVLMRGSVERERAEDSAGYDSRMDRFSKAIAAGVFTLLFGVSLMMALMGLTLYGISEFIAMAVFFGFLVVSVAIFIVAGMRQDNFEQKHPYIQPFYTEDRRDAFKSRLVMLIAVPTVAILLGVLLLMVLCEVVERPATLDQESWETLAASLFMLIVAASVATYTYAGIQSDKYDVEGYNRRHDPSPEARRRRDFVGKCCGCIMLTATLIYVVSGLGWELWDRMWIVFPAGGILCAIVSTALEKSSI